MVDTVRVRARRSVYGLAFGQVATLPLTPHVDVLMHAGHLEPVDEPSSPELAAAPR